jgi:putative transposase
VSGFYPSRKMGVTIQFESHRVESAAIYEMKHDPQTLEFYDQPQAITLDYSSASGRRQVGRQTPDFFVLRQDAAGWEEWKTEDELKRLAEHSLNRYRQEAGCWQRPPGRAMRASLGCTIASARPKRINWRFQRNVLFLQDYMRSDSGGIPAVAEARIVSYLCALPGISLAELVEQANFATRDDIYLLIAAGRLYVNLHMGLLIEPATVRVFPDRHAALQLGAAQDIRPVRHSLLPPFQTLRAGAVITWDGRAWQVANIGSTSIALLVEDGRLLELPDPTVESLIKERRIRQLPDDCELNTCHRISDALLDASEEDLRVANHRGQRCSSTSVRGESDWSRRTGATLRRWISRYRATESQAVAGYIGLLPPTGHRGNPTGHLSNRPLADGEALFREDSDAVRRLQLRFRFPERTCQPNVPIIAAANRSEQQRPRLRYPKRDMAGVEKQNVPGDTL